MSCAILPASWPETATPGFGMLGAARMRDDDRIADAYRRHAPAVFRRAREILGVDADAREVVQDLFLSLFENPAQFQGRSSLTTFLYRATTHACLNRVRDQKNRTRLVQERFSVGDESDRRLSPEQTSMLHRALRRMPQDLATVAVHYLVDGLTQEEIARVLECSRRHVGHLLEQLEQWHEREEGASC